jgi:NAD(P) transhydrogenase subunit alpha
MPAGGFAFPATLVSPSRVRCSHDLRAQNEPTLKVLLARKVTQLAMELVPRVTRAQKLDALSSMANIAGYRAVIEACHVFGRPFTGQITAAGKIPPAKVLVIGAGVAGLAAIGVAKSLGAIVRAFDVRPVVKQEVESMGAEFLMLDFKEDGSGSGGYAKIMSKEFIDAEMALFARQAKEVDIIITTAQIPNRPAPRLILNYMVETMRRGSVVVDLAAASGGNCEATRNGELVVTPNGVTVIGYSDLPSRMPAISSQLFSSNICHLLDDLGKADKFNINEQDDVVRPMIVCRGGEMKWPPPKKEAPAPAAAAEAKGRPAAAAAAPAAPAAAAPPTPAPSARPPSLVQSGLNILLVTGIVFAIGSLTPRSFHSNMVVFVLSALLGYVLVWGVKPALHTPLMSFTNAISGLVLLAAIDQIGNDLDIAGRRLAFVSALVANVNVVGGFYVTQRMLNMFFK